MREIPLTIEQIALERLTPYARNSKLHTPAQIRHIANSIEAFGFNDPLAVCGPENIVLEGNGRIEAARLLGMTRLPCVRLDHLSEAEQRAYIIAHNALNLETGFDESILTQELEALRQFTFDDFGLQTERYLADLSDLRELTLRPYEKVHYLISLDINQNDQVAGLIKQLAETEGVEVESSLDADR
ncbi:MAG: ParB/Srx family N-terminal domain-containing protein [Candidatus Howiella sp.]|jgi:ParB-like chromosome segregation protein Spo0J